MTVTTSEQIEQALNHVFYIYITLENNEKNSMYMYQESQLVVISASAFISASLKPLASTDV